jgi:hypothetical protein
MCRSIGGHTSRKKRTPSTKKAYDCLISHPFCNEIRGLFELRLISQARLRHGI